jgi:hypothetical protein
MLSEHVRETAPLKAMVELRQAEGDARRPGGDQRRRLGSGGFDLGLSGSERSGVVGASLIGLAIAGAICVFNVLTRAHDRPTDGVLLPVVLEGSSYLTTMIALAAPATVAVWLGRARPPPWRAALAIAAGLIVYFAVHVGGFSILRALALPLLLKDRYRPGSPVRELPYEFAKDLLTYVLALVMTGVVLRWRAAAQTVPQAAPESFDIRDGARLVRVPVGEILAVRSAGNYVEFLLSDGRRPLMRTPLGALEQELASQGFVRTHRSWLVNAARVTGLRPEGSGDYAVELGAMEVPLSRRFPNALAALRR